jgi:HPt (histidine-containing phosphotransfer) domain-containing protein
VAVTPVVLKVETALATCRGDLALARMLIDQYRTSLPEERAALVRAQAATPPDWEAVRERIHRLQSGGGFLGIERIAVAAQRLEAEILAQATPTVLDAAWRGLDGAFDEFLAVPNEEWERRLRVVHRPADGAAP